MQTIKQLLDQLSFVVQCKTNLLLKENGQLMQFVLNLYS